MVVPVWPHTWVLLWVCYGLQLPGIRTEGLTLVCVAKYFTD